MTQVMFTMGSVRATEVHRLRSKAGVIFGPEFKQTWFATKYKRVTVDKLQVSSGAYITTKGKKYRLLPPVLFPDTSENKKDVFLNPALVKASVLLYQVFATCILIMLRC